MVGKKEGKGTYANEYRRAHHIDVAFFRVVFWDWLYFKYVTENVVDYGYYLSYYWLFNYR